MNWKAAKTSVWLCLIFLLVYNPCNYITSLRHNVPSFYFWWEDYIPFVPIFIVPYMSLDLLFIAAPFICREDIERRVLSRRILAAYLIAAVCFLLFPLKCHFPRQHVDGWLGVIFNNFRAVDQPFNQCPSLHMALRTILAVLYARRFPGLLAWVFHIWFSLIGFSTVLTYQHHVIDVIGGAALGILCVYVFQEHPLRLPVIINKRVGLYYLSGSLMLIALIALIGNWAWLLVWPASSLLLVSLAYFGLGPGIYRKRDGKLALSARLMLWPVILGQRLSLMHYARQCEPWHVLTPNLWIGRRLSNEEAQRAIAAGVSAVLDLTSECAEAAPFLAIRYHHLPVMDLTAPTPLQIDEAVNFIREQAAKGVVYVHCKAGYSRTAAIAGAYLLAIGESATAEQAAARIRAARPAIVIRPEAMRAIDEFGTRRDRG